MAAALCPALRQVVVRAALSRARHHRLHHSQLAHTSYRCKSSKVQDPEEIDLDKPFKFSTSRAATWKPRESYGIPESEDKVPWYQPYVVVASIATFLVYFCVLREENEMDQSLRKNLYDHIEGLEEQQLEISLEHNIQMGKDTSAITARLKEIREAQGNKPNPS